MPQTLNDCSCDIYLSTLQMQAPLEIVTSFKVEPGNYTRNHKDVWNQKLVDRIGDILKN